MLHNAVGSMPAQPEKDPNTEEIINPVEEVEETETNQLNGDVPENTTEGSELAPEETNAPEAQNDTNQEVAAPSDNSVAPEAPTEEEMDPEGDEPVVEPINE